MVDVDGAVASTNADAVAIPGSVAGAVTLNVTYKNTLNDANDIIYGKTSDNAVNVKIYAIYTVGSIDYKVPLNVKIQDCICCGAFIAPNVWRNFMCRNLGADQNLDFSVMKPEIYGDFYSMGSQIPGRNYLGKPTVPSYIPPGDQTPYDLTSWKTSVGANKAPKDPCPAGYRVPTLAEWKGVIDNNTFTVVTTVVTGKGTYTGAKFGQSLYIPRGGYTVGRVNTPSSPTGIYLHALGSLSTKASPNIQAPFSLYQYGNTATQLSDDIVPYMYWIAQMPIRCIEQL